MIGGITQERARELARDAASRHDGRLYTRRGPAEGFSLDAVFTLIDTAHGLTHEFTSTVSLLHVTKNRQTLSFNLL